MARGGLKALDSGYACEGSPRQKEEAGSSGWPPQPTDASSMSKSSLLKHEHYVYKSVPSITTWALPFKTQTGWVIIDSGLCTFPCFLWQPVTLASPCPPSVSLTSRTNEKYKLIVQCSEKVKCFCVYISSKVKVYGICTQNIVNYKDGYRNVLYTSIIFKSKTVEPA